MTREEALMWLRDITYSAFDRTTAKERQAVRMAIEALQEKEMHDSIPDKLLTEDEKKSLVDQCANNAQSDLISRAEAIEAIPDTRADMFENCRNCKLLDREQVVDILSALPSAETHEIHTETHECVKNTHDSDLISREEVCEAMERYERHFNTKLETLKDLVAELPNYFADRPTRGRKDATEEDYHYCDDCEAVEMCMWYPYHECQFKVSRPSGEWIKKDEYHLDNVFEIECDQCGSGMWQSRNEEKYPNYCYNCGARMKSEVEE